MKLFEQLAAIASRGSTTSKAKSLGGLHEKRREHLSQFFTPEWVVDFAWRSIADCFKEDKTYSLLDNSCGAGVWFSKAKPEQHKLYGFDVDENLVTQVQDLLDDSGFNVDIRAGDMASAYLPNVSAALINPPFSIQLESPHLKPYAGVTHYGKFGSNTSALSQEYALAQALDCAAIVCAVVPSSVTARLGDIAIAKSRLCAVYHLPADTFRSENVRSVSTDLLIFGKRPCVNPIETSITPETVATPLGNIDCPSVPEMRSGQFGFYGQEDDKPVITLPRTDDKRVKMTRRGRKIKLRFFDGLTEARVLNRLYGFKLHSTVAHRYPAEVKYNGSLRLSLDVLMMQDDPRGAFDSLVDDIKGWGGEPVIQPELLAAFSSLGKEKTYMETPFGLTVFRPGQGGMTATANKTGLLNYQDKGAAVRAGETVKVEADDCGYQVTTTRGTFAVEHDRFHGLFDVTSQADNGGGWVRVHRPIREVHPQRIAQIEQRMRQVITAKHLSWDFQFEDALEIAFKPKGCIIALEMALGKSRMAITQALYHGGASLLIVKPHLVSEMERELEKLGLDKAVYQVVETPNQARSLKKLNIISYNRLRGPVHLALPKLTYSKLLKNRVANVFADEGGLVANQDSQQSKAIKQLNAKRHYLLDGTPGSNYPREFLPLITQTVGGSRCYQPYSINGPYIKPSHINSAKGCEIGRNAFLGRFSMFEWVTNQFVNEDNGAKREVPKVPAEQLPDFRALLAPIVKRRTQQEPDVKACVEFPVPDVAEPTIVPWDMAHLEVYYKVCTEFAEWYQNYKAKCDEDKKNLSLVIILARLEACFKAANVPQTLSGIVSPYTELTSKDRYVIADLIQEVKDGNRPMMFAKSPKTINRIAQHLEAAGLDVLCLTGEQPPKPRMAEFQRRVRGETCVDVILATFGTAQDGLNITQMNRLKFYNRSFRYREERQAIFRLLRADQCSDVVVDYYHLEGSIDEYMAQLSDWKGTSFTSSLDYGASNTEEFHHFDAMLDGFLTSIPYLRERLKQAA